MKCQGSEESTRIIWLNNEYCNRVCRSELSSTMANLSGSKQLGKEHIEMTCPHMKRDAEALSKLLTLKKNNGPFHLTDQECLVSLIFGV